MKNEYKIDTGIPLPEPKNFYAHVDFKASTYATNEADPDDAWSRESTSTDWEMPDDYTVLSADRYGAIPLTFMPEEGKDYFMVYYIWSTGDSFGNDESSNCEIHGIYKTEEEAKAEEKKLGEVTDHSVPWNGEFESLVTLETKRITFKQVKK